MSRARRLAALLLAGAGLVAGLAGAQDAQAPAPDPAATPVGDAGLRDPDFRVHGPELGLARRVEMFQWVPRGDGYDRGWSDAPLGGEGEHENPPFPLRSERWLPERITVDGHPLAREVVQRLAQWREFRPAFSSLPGNLSATFQPEGNGLGSAENPLDPQIGDLRIHWLERTLPPLGERIELRGGEWVLRPGAPVAPSVATDRPAWMGAWLPILAGVGALLLLAVVLVRRRRR